ncbi:glutamic-type intramembrane protease PrsW [Alkalihalobacillus sp. MEB130]|uniref:glutamic-type intramembrane protease PrsW n=1 Tax=Alkalihalobacillus sp. MEB130 TaxID=2976704 RepID=UPI0028DFD0AA|nr:glutamic-type intramembrane protease PrsW [Alkalihalobacillus sp. MEB130]MDT8860040.1 glutamic-type intramembrane protease PrsW [Alkalihalobacillus sp. MEB130]
MFALVTAAVAPGMALLSYFYLRNHYSTNAVSLVFRTFLIGVLLVFPVMVLQYAFTAEGYLTHPVAKAFILYGFVEEFFKWLLLWLFAYQHATFARRYDGIVYGVSLSLGFATLENVIYLIANGLETAFGRALLPVSSHALYGVIMGYYMGRAKVEVEKRRQHLTMSLLLPILLHGVYDFILLFFGMYFLIGLIPFMFFLWWVALKKVKRAHQLDW